VLIISDRHSSAIKIILNKLMTLKHSIMLSSSISKKWEFSILCMQIRKMIFILLSMLLHYHHKFGLCMVKEKRLRENTSSSAMNRTNQFYLYLNTQSNAMNMMMILESLLLWEMFSILPLINLRQTSIRSKSSDYSWKKCKWQSQVRILSAWIKA